MKKFITFILVLTLVTSIGVLAKNYNFKKIDLQRKSVELESTSAKLKSQELKLRELNSQLDQELQSKELDKQKIEELEKKRLELEAQLQAKIKAKEEARIAFENQQLIKKAQAQADRRCGDNDYAYQIYKQESGCRLDAVNPIGACGLGQSLPCSKLASVCPDWQVDYDCQNAFFTQYAMQYGGWSQAYSFKYCTGVCYSTRTKTNTNKGGEIWW